MFDKREQSTTSLVLYERWAVDDPVLDCAIFICDYMMYKWSMEEAVLRTLNNAGGVIPTEDEFAASFPTEWDRQVYEQQCRMFQLVYGQDIVVATKSQLDSVMTLPTFTRIISMASGEPWMLWNRWESRYEESDEHFRARILDALHAQEEQDKAGE